MDCPPVSPSGERGPRGSPGTGRGGGAHREPVVKVGSAPGARPGRGEAGRRGSGTGSWRGWGAVPVVLRGSPLRLGRHREHGRGGAARGGGRLLAGVGGGGRGGGGGRASPLSSRGSRGGWERPLRALLGPQGSASSGRSGGLRTTGQGTGTAWSREPRSPPSVGTTWRSQKGLAFGLKALTAPPLC